MKKYKTNEGFIKWIIIIVIALIILGYYGFDIRRAVESPTAQSNLNYAQQGVLYVWDHFLRYIVEFVWNNLILPLLRK